MSELIKVHHDPKAGPQIQLRIARISNGWLLKSGDQKFFSTAEDLLDELNDALERVMEEIEQEGD